MKNGLKKLNPLQKLKEKRLADKYTEELEHEGVVLFRPTEIEGGSLSINSDYLTLPPNITELPPQELGEHLNALTQQKMYLRTLVGWQESNVEEAKRAYYKLSAAEYQKLDKRLSEVAKDRILSGMAGISDAFVTLRDEERRLSMLLGNLASIDDAVFLVSREITRRCGDIDLTNRNQNVGGIRRQ